MQPSQHIDIDIVLLIIGNKNPNLNSSSSDSKFLQQIKLKTFLKIFRSEQFFYFPKFEKNSSKLNHFKKSSEIISKLRNYFYMEI